MSYFAENLLDSYLGDVRFDSVTRTVKIGREFTRYKYPYRNGQGVEDLGRKVYVFEHRVSLHRGVREADYPKTSDDLLALVLDDTNKGEVEYIDPEFGAFDVKIVEADWSINSGATDGGEMTLVLEEIGFEQDLLGNLGIGKLSARGQAAKMAARTDYLIDVYYAAIDTEKPAGFSLTDTWAKVQDTLDTVALSADGVASVIDEYTSIASKALNFSPTEEIARWSITNAAIDAMGFAMDVGNDAATGELGDGFIEETLPDTMSVIEIAARYYGDPSRSDEVMFANSFPNPLAVERGTKVLVTR